MEAKFGDTRAFGLYPDVVAQYGNCLLYTSDAADE